jgi:CRP-like cAMP-binding protein
MEELIALLCKLSPLTDACQDRLRQIIKCRKISKKEYLLRAGEINDKMHFIKEGFLRCYYREKITDAEVTSWLYTEGELVVSVRSYYRQVPGEEYIHAVEDSLLYYITYEEELQLFKEFHEYSELGRNLEIKYVLDFDRQLQNLRMLTKTQRYQQLLEKNSGLVHRAPVMYLASYLDMTPESLSRVRGQFSK